MPALDVQPSDDELLERYGRAEAALESGPYLRYREILARGLGEVCRGYGIEPTEDGGRGLRGVGRRLAGVPRFRGVARPAARPGSASG